MNHLVSKLINRNYLCHHNALLMNWFLKYTCKPHINTNWSQHPDLFILGSSILSALTQVWCRVDLWRTKYHGRWWCCYITWALTASPAETHTAMFCSSCALFCCCAAASSCQNARACYRHFASCLMLCYSDIVGVCVCVFQEWKDGLASPEDLSPATLQSHSYITDSLIGCTSLPNTQVCLHDIL